MTGCCPLVLSYSATECDTAQLMQVLVIMVLDPAMTGLKTNSIVHGPPLSPADTVREQQTEDAASSQTSVISLDEES